MLFVDFLDLKDFPYGTLSEIAADDSSQQILRLSWRWLLLLRTFQLLLSDEGAHPADGVDAQRLSRSLARQGLLPSKSITDLSLRSAQIAVTGRLPSLFEGSLSVEFGSRQVELSDATGRLLDVVSGFRSESRHLVVVDGLDELLSPDGATYGSLSALLGEIESLNDAFYRSESAFKFILLCRSELYERLASPNKNKIRQNFAIRLKWTLGDDRADESDLLNLILQRARLSGYVGQSPIDDLLPRKYKTDNTRVDTWPYLLSHTRHTPRDLIALLSNIQESMRGRNVTNSAIYKGLGTYSSEYFVPELKDELEGYMSPEDIDEIFGLLSSIQKRVFLVEEVERLADRRRLSLPAVDALQILFECSALGQERSTESGADHRFRYMDSNLAVNPDVPFIIHRGAWIGLKLPA